MDSAIDTFLLDEIEVGSFPSAVYVIGSSQRIEAENAPGCAVTDPLRLRAGVDAIYVCASITKTLIATTCKPSSVEQFHTVR